MWFFGYRLPARQMRETIAGLLKHPEPAIYVLEDIAAAHQRVEAGANAKVLIRL